MSDDKKNAFSEKTVVFAQSNLKETFDARTVVRSSKPASEPAPVSTEIGGSPMRRDADKGLPPKKNLTQNERRAERQALDRKKSRMIAAFATFCGVVILGLVMAFGGPKSTESTSSTTPLKAAAGEKTELASEMPAVGKKPHDAENFLTTTDVLTKFDRAAQKSQEHALDYSKSSSGF